MINKPPNKNPIDITIQLIILSSLALAIAGFNKEKKLAEIIIPAPKDKKQSNNFFHSTSYAKKRRYMRLYTVAFTIDS